MSAQTEDTGMDPALLQLWLAALRGTSHRQGKHRLCAAPLAYCPIGVLLDVSRIGRWERFRSARTTRELPFFAYAWIDPTSAREESVLSCLSPAMRTALRLPSALEQQIIAFNDTHGLSFTEIADFLDTLNLALPWGADI